MATEMTVQQAKDALKNLPATATWWDIDKAKKDLYNAYQRDKNATLEDLDDDEDGGDGSDDNGGDSNGAVPTTPQPKRPK